MSKLATILAVVIVLASQFALVVPAVMNDKSFRHQERLDTHKAMVDNPTLDTKANFQKEVELEQQHRMHEQFFRGVSYFGVLVFFEGIGFYFWIQYRKKQSVS